jgi:THO complex subunit 2
VIEKKNKLVLKLNKELAQIQQNQANCKQLIEQVAAEEGFMEGVQINDITNSFIQNCLTPRVRLSPQDAVYCVRFLEKIKDLKWKKINILHILSLTNKNFLPVIHASSHKESENIGVFLNELLLMLNRLKEPTVWEKECANNPVFTLTVGSNDYAGRDKFQSIVKTINQRITYNLVSNIKSQTYHKIKNSLTILQMMMETYPKTYDNFNSIEDALY